MERRAVVAPATTEIRVEDRWSLETAVAKAPISPAGPSAVHPRLVDVMPEFGRLCEKVRGVIHAHGYAVVRAIVAEDRVLLALAGAVGRAVTTGNGDPGVLVYDVTPSDGASGGLPGSRTRETFALHTDGTGLLDPPHHVMLACVAAPADSGYNVIAPLHDVLAAVRRLEGADAVEALREPRFVLSLADAAGVRLPTAVPVVWGSAGQEHIRYRPRMASVVGGELTGRHRKALAALDQAVAAEVTPMTLLLRPDDALLIDNRRMLHGRTEIRPGAHRHLKRLKIYPESRMPRCHTSRVSNASGGRPR